jgi:lysophospholipase L1-like esterase
MQKFLYRSYVALGDSLTEGLGDTGFTKNRLSKGWADRLAGILAAEAKQFGEPFEYANLAVRGQTIAEILTSQLEDALRIKPDLVTIMAGANDIMSSSRNHNSVRALLRGAISRLHDEGIHVLVVNTVNPAHYPVFGLMAKKSREMSDLIEGVAQEFEAPVLDLYSLEQFGRMSFWYEDLVHFSDHGHAMIANLAAEKLKLSFRLPEQPHDEIAEPKWGVFETLRWLILYVVPFWGRRIRRVSSGDRIDPKQFDLELFEASPEAYSTFVLPGTRAKAPKAVAKK